MFFINGILITAAIICMIFGFSWDNPWLVVVSNLTLIQCFNDFSEYVQGISFFNE